VEDYGVRGVCAGIYDEMGDVCKWGLLCAEEIMAGVSEGAELLSRVCTADVR